MITTQPIQMRLGFSAPISSVAVDVGTVIVRSVSFFINSFGDEEAVCAVNVCRQLIGALARYSSIKSNNSLVPTIIFFAVADFMMVGS